eukprot:10742040-Karenia_brevis.AAC.1
MVLKNYMRQHKFHVLFVEEARSKKGVFHLDRCAATGDKGVLCICSGSTPEKQRGVEIWIDFEQRVTSDKCFARPQFRILHMHHSMLVVAAHFQGI